MEYEEIVEAHSLAVVSDEGALAAAVDAEEWFDMIAELPAEYSALIPERSA